MTVHTSAIVEEAGTGKHRVEGSLRPGNVETKRLMDWKGIFGV